jgi:hypothetical protein
LKNKADAVLKLLDEQYKSRKVAAMIQQLELWKQDYGEHYAVEVFNSRHPDAIHNMRVSATHPLHVGALLRQGCASTRDTRCQR